MKKNRRLAALATANSRRRGGFEEGFRHAAAAAAATKAATAIESIAETQKKHEADVNQRELDRLKSLQEEMAAKAKADADARQAGPGSLRIVSKQSVQRGKRPQEQGSGRKNCLSSHKS